MRKNRYLIMFVFVLFIVFGSVTARYLNDEEYYRLPHLFHLDNYNECLSHSDGLYCLGVFEVSPGPGTNEVYHLIKEYTEEIYTYNRTLLHRGYCVSSRCPQHNVTNTTQHFARCTAKLTEQYNLTTTLRTLHYCHERSVVTASEVDVWQLVFLIVGCVFVMMNIVGTLYDYKMDDNTTKIKALTAWSAIQNWEVLTKSTNSNNKSSYLAALHGVRVFITIFSCLVHSTMVYFMMYLNDPRLMENIISNPMAMFIQNSTGMQQITIVISLFLNAYFLKQASAKIPVSYKSIPTFIAKRLIRLAPVSILTIGFAATWWPVISSGPIWPITVGAESQVCKQKFWSHLLFLNNLLDAEKLCVMPTWYMAVDFQMHILSTIVMVFLLRLPTGTLPILSLLLIGCCLLNAGLAYVFDWMPMLYLTVAPENLRTLFRDVPSFTGLYISPWGSMPACFLGLILGHVLYGLKLRKRIQESTTEHKFNLRKYRWLLNICCVISVPLLFGWVLVGYFLQHIRVKMFMVTYAAFERSVCQILLLMAYMLLCVACGFFTKVLAWRGWHAMSRMSLPVMMIHWMVNMYLVASTKQPINTSFTDIIVYGVSTTVYSFLLAIPITVLVQLPIKKTFNHFDKVN